MKLTEMRLASFCIMCLSMASEDGVVRPMLSLFIHIIKDSSALTVMTTADIYLGAAQPLQCKEHGCHIMWDAGQMKPCA